MEAKAPAVVAEEPPLAEAKRKKYVPNLKPSELKPGDAYKWKKDDTLIDVARRMGVPVERLREYNEIEGWNELEAGVIIYKPKDAPVKDKRETRFEFLPKPVDMHVAPANGAKKWRFGHADGKWENISGTGFYPQNTNVKIVAIAYVPIDDETNPELEAAYYMDSLAVGDYAETGRLKYTVGFMHSDLEEGAAVTVKTVSIPEVAKVPVPEPEEEVATVIEVASEETPPKPERVEFFGTDRAFIENRLEYFKREGNMAKFVETYQPLTPHVACTAIIPEDQIEVDAEGRKFVWIHDFLTSRPDRKLTQHWEGHIAGTFEYEGVTYGRPAAALKNHLWFGIPMDLLESQARLYNDDTDTETKSTSGRLTWFEDNFWVPLAKWANKNKKKKG